MFSRNLLAVAFFAMVSGAPQQVHLPPGISQGPGGEVPMTSDDPVQRDQAVAAYVQRQVEIRRDTEAMLQLTTELKDYLQRTDQSKISMDAIKKAEKIEKLAHSVKSKMKQSL
ncbi:MAG TPA: hypothetical protein VFE61_19640 [Candidatus Sulfotelmatobacter sp.]|jgi:hypothetical protein|nr:hypothetical protein [Candidatus Sulfotelmatobacter sp.]